MNEVFKFIKTIYPSLKIYYQAEEDGNGVFITNDAEGHYFRDRYRIEYDLDYEYFTTIEGVLGYVSGVIGKELKSKAAMEAAINDWNDNTEDDDRKFYFVEYEIVADEHLWV